MNLWFLTLQSLKTVRKDKHWARRALEKMNFGFPTLQSSNSDKAALILSPKIQPFDGVNVTHAEAIWMLGTLSTSILVNLLACSEALKLKKFE